MDKALIIPEKGREDYWEKADFVVVGSDEDIEALERSLDLFEDEPECESALILRRKLDEARKINTEIKRQSKEA